MIFDALVLSQIRRSPALAAVVALAIALGVAAIVAIDLAGARADRALRATVDALGDRATLHVVSASGGRVDERTLAIVRDLPGVRDARPVLDGFVARRDARGDERPLHVAGIDTLAAFPGSPALRAYDAGPFAPPGALDRALVAGGIVLSRDLARELDVTTGSTLAIRATGGTFAAPVAAVVARPVPGVDPSLALVDVTTAQRFFAAAGALDRIDVVTDGATAAGVRARVSPARVVATADAVVALERATAGFALDLRLLGTIASFVAAALVANAVAVSVRRRRADIATVRALGASRRRVFATFVFEGTLYGALGGTLGALVGDALAEAFAPAWGVATDDLALVARDVAIGIAFATFAAVVPAWRAALVVPALAFRASAPRAPRRAVRYVARATRSLPVRLAFAGLAATATQAAVALVALALATAASAGASIAAASFASAVDAWSARAMPGDLALRSLPFAPAAMPERVRARIARVPGVARVATSRRIEIEVRRTPASLLALDGETFAARGGRVGTDALVTPELAARLGVRPGDAFALAGPRGRATLRVATLDDDYGSALGTIAVDARTYERLYGDATSDDVFITLAPRADVARVRDRLARIAAPERIVVRPIGAMRASAVASFARALSLGAALGAVAIVIAIAGGALTFVALVAERRDEYRMLRTVGLSRAGLRAAIALEAALFATTGAALGSLAGVGIGAWLVRLAAGAGGWRTPPQVPAFALIATAAAVVVVTTLVALVPTAAAARIVRATR